MARPRADLSKILHTFGAVKVYFQPETNTRMEYPCIVYQVDDRPASHADNLPYLIGTRYLITVMDEKPDSPIAAKVAQLPSSSFNRAFTADDLNHEVYTVYF